ncbi:unnamed protein product [Ilex paraguariensis]|uniref:Uncharacterized protein n=1 Tax=Ilex paraguariensis TaxID=185542 RepID=A0ABC8TFK2_9AQUA
MLTSKPQIKLSDEDEEFLTAMRFPIGAVLPMVLKAAIELDLFEIMAKTSPGGRRLSSSEIASQLPTRNPEAPVMLDRMLRFLASNSILTCTLNRDESGDAKRSYGLTPICKYFVRDQHGVSLSPSVLLLQDKWILHDWSDDHCLKLLKNCWNALPDSGKVIAVESILPEYPETDLLSQTIIGSDMVMLTLNPGGKERTEKEYEALVKAAGFAALKLICCVQSYWIMEFYKKCNF